MLLYLSVLCLDVVALVATRRYLRLLILLSAVLFLHTNTSHTNTYLTCAHGNVYNTSCLFLLKF